MPRPDIDARAPPAWTHFRLDQRSPSYWRVTFDHPPINTITAATVIELSELVDLIEGSPELNVIVFDSAYPDFFLAHYDTEHNPAATLGLPTGPTGMNAWLGQFEVGIGVPPGGGPMARLSRLVGRGRPLEILLVGGDFDGPRAELYGYVNRAIADETLDDEVHEIAARLAGFEHEAIARIKSYVDQVTLPPDDGLPPALGDFFAMLGRPETPARSARLEELGLNTDGDLERRLGERVVESASASRIAV